MDKPQLFTCMTFADADRMFAFLTAIGFQEVLVVRDPEDESRVQHAQFRWRDNGGLMCGSVREEDPVGFASTPGIGRCNLVVADDAAVDDTLARALTAGATLVQDAHNPPHGGRSAAVSDLEGNLWNFDSYQGE